MRWERSGLSAASSGRSSTSRSRPTATRSCPIACWLVSAARRSSSHGVRFRSASSPPASCSSGSAASTRFWWWRPRRRPSASPRASRGRFARRLARKNCSALPDERDGLSRQTLATTGEAELVRRRRSHAYGRAEDLTKGASHLLAPRRDARLLADQHAVRIDDRTAGLTDLLERGTQE